MNASIPTSVPVSLPSSGPRPESSPAGAWAAGLVNAHVLTACAEPLWRERHDAKLRGLIVDEERPLVLVGRSASPILTVVEDLRLAAERLRDVAGFDATECLPDDGQLDDLWRTRAIDLNPVARTSRACGSRYLIVDLTGSGLVLFMSSGVSRMDGQHPGEVLAEILTHFSPRPAGTFAARTDRYARNLVAISTVFTALEHLHATSGAWAGDGSVGRWVLDRAGGTSGTGETGSVW